MKRMLMPVFNHIDYDGRVQRIAQSLSQSFEVTVMSLDSGLKYQNEHFSLHAIQIHTKHKILQHVIFWLQLLLFAVKYRPHIIYAHDYYLPFPGWFIARLIGALIIYDAHELIIPEKGLSQDRRERLFYFLERLVIKHFDIVIAANQERAELMSKFYKLKEIPVVVRNIPPEPTKGDIQLSDSLRELFEEKDEVIWLVYQGDINADRGVGHFISAMKYLDERYRLLLVGGGKDVEVFRDFVQLENLQEKVILLGKVPRSQLHPIMTCCDLGIITYPTKGLNNIYCAPNKIYEYAQAGLPIVASCQPPLKKIISHYNIGVVCCCDEENEDKIIQVAESIKRAVEQKEMFQNNIQFFLAEHRWEVESEKVLLKLKNLGH